MSGRRGRRLNPEEAALWGAVARSIRPLPPRTPDANWASDAPAPVMPVPASIAAPARDVAPAGPRLGAGDPRTARRVARGRLGIEATIDLHGMTQRDAQAALTAFIAAARARGHRVILVITGHGAAGAMKPDGLARGILRQRFMEWIDGPPLRQHVSAAHPAAAHHGGRGAFYVFLRRRP